MSLDPLPLRSRTGSAGVGLAKSARLVWFAEWRALGGKEGKSLNLSGLTSVMQLIPAHLSHEIWPSLLELASWGPNGMESHWLKDATMRPDGKVSSALFDSIQTHCPAYRITNRPLLHVGTC
jgi:hypothetical protein